MRKKVIFLIITLFLIKPSIHALSYAGCEYSTVSKYKSLVTNVNISYDYRIVNGKVYFDVTLTNITPGMYFRDSQTGKTYTYNNTSNGEITIKNYTGNSGSYKFYSNTKNCNSILMGTKYYKFPIYNQYYNDPLCSDISGYSLCQRWVNKNISYSEFKKLVNEYKESLKVIDVPEEPEVINKNFLDNIIDFYVKYYYLMLPIIIIICVIVMYNQRKKNKFDL